MKPRLFLEKKDHCSFCGCRAFSFIDMDSCSSCENNGIRDDDGWCYRTLQESETREEVADDGECLLGNAYGDGCSIIVCDKCQQLHKHIPVGLD